MFFPYTVLNKLRQRLPCALSCLYSSSLCPALPPPLGVSEERKGKRTNCPEAPQMFRGSCSWLYAGSDFLQKGSNIELPKVRESQCCGLGEEPGKAVCCLFVCFDLKKIFFKLLGGILCLCVRVCLSILLPCPGCLAVPGGEGDGHKCRQGHFPTLYHSEQRTTVKMFYTKSRM